MALWLGIMKIAEDSGLLALAARAITPILKKLFPGVPAGHPAMASMTMNIAANMLGLSNAATPMGLKAMEDLNAQHAPRCGDQCHVHVSDHQYRGTSAGPRDGNRCSGVCRFEGSDGNYWDDDYSDFHGSDCGGHYRETIGEIASFFG